MEQMDDNRGLMIIHNAFNRHYLTIDFSLFLVDFNTNMMKYSYKFYFNKNMTRYLYNFYFHAVWV